MDYNTLLDLATDLGYRLAMSGAETYRVEESINLLLNAYGITSEVFAIPNCLTVSIETQDGQPLTRMKRIGYHGNDLDSVERYTNLSRKLCAEKPDPKTAQKLLNETTASCTVYSRPIYFAGNFLAACGFAIFFGSTIPDSLLAGLCGILVGYVGLIMDKLKANLFFRTIIASFLMSLLAYSMSSFHIAQNADTVIIGTLMILVPGLLFTNAMRDIIYGDTNSGTNRIVQVFLIAAAIALGTAAAWNLTTYLWDTPLSIVTISCGLSVELFGCFLGCIGFSILFNIHGPGMLLCAIGGLLSWCIYHAVFSISGSDLAGYFWAALTASMYSEIMARIRKYPAFSYLVVSIFPLIPGAGVYYTMTHALRNDMGKFADQGLHTIAIAGAIAVGILLISTTFRIWTTWKRTRQK